MKENGPTVDDSVDLEGVDKYKPGELHVHLSFEG
jgi:hypothetical protein